MVYNCNDLYFLANCLSQIKKFRCFPLHTLSYTDFILWIFVLLPIKAKNKFTKVLLHLLLSSLVITLMTAVLSFGTYIIWEKPTFYNRLFPKQVDELQLDSTGDRYKKLNVTTSSSEKFTSAFSFYERRFALAFKNGMYGFIDKEGNPVIPYNYKRAEPFTYTGYARVQKEAEGSNRLIDFLIDTSKNLYKVAYRVEDLKPDIEALDLSDQKLSTIPKEIFVNRQLKILLLNGEYDRINKINSLPDDLFQLENLQTLALVSFGIIELSPNIERLKNLTSLWLANNKVLKNLPENIGKLTRLESLDLTGSDSLKTLPPEIGKLYNLRNLYLSSCTNLSILPKELWQLINLKDLIISRSKLTSLSSNIKNLVNLKTLFLNENTNLNGVPAEIWELSNLQSLILGGTNLNQSPPRLQKLVKLTELNLERTNINDIPEGIGNLNNLTNLYLGGNRGIEQISDSIWKLTKLTDLVLSGIGITELPNGIGNLTNLTTLYLDNLNLTRLPNEVAALTSLTVLELENNNFRELPTALLSLVNLRILYLHGNKYLLDLPPGFEKLVNLEKLYLSGTPISSLNFKNSRKTYHTVKFILDSLFLSSVSNFLLSAQGLFAVPLLSVVF